MHALVWAYVVDFYGSGIFWQGSCMSSFGDKQASGGVCGYRLVSGLYKT